MGETEDFEWDDGKDEANLEKHGLPLRFAVLLFDDPYLLLAKARVTTEGELRHIVVGTIGQRVLTCIYTVRGTRKRLISLRAARRSERRVYATQIDKKAD